MRFEDLIAENGVVQGCVSSSIGAISISAAHAKMR